MSEGNGVAAAAAGLARDLATTRDGLVVAAWRVGLAAVSAERRTPSEQAHALSEALSATEGAIQELTALRRRLAVVMEGERE